MEAGLRGDSRSQVVYLCDAVFEGRLHISAPPFLPASGEESGWHCSGNTGGMSASNCLRRIASGPVGTNTKVYGAFAPGGASD